MAQTKNVTVIREPTFQGAYMRKVTPGVGDTLANIRQQFASCDITNRMSSHLSTLQNIRSKMSVNNDLKENYLIPVVGAVVFALELATTIVVCVLLLNDEFENAQDFIVTSKLQHSTEFPCTCPEKSAAGRLQDDVILQGYPDQTMDSTKASERNDHRTSITDSCCEIDLHTLKKVCIELFKGKM